jgi:hypothetical protein
MREPDTGFLQLLADDRGVRDNIGSVDRHFPRWVVAGRALSNAVLRLRLFRDGEGFVCPIRRRRTGPTLNLGRRDRFQQLSGGLTHVFTYGPEHKARIPSGMQIRATYPGHRYAVSASIVFERDVKRLMDVADPMAEKLQRCALLRLARVIGRQNIEILLDRSPRVCSGGLGGRLFHR